jgi:hypothetical protein
MKQLQALMCVVLTACVAAAPALAQDVPPEKPQQKSQSFEVIALANAVADEAASVILPLLPQDARAGTKIMADPRINALIVTGDEASIALVKRLVAQIDVPAAPKAAAPRRAATYEVVLFVLAPGAEEALKLPVTSVGVIDAGEAESVLGRIREGLGKGGSVTELSKWSLTADDWRPWKSRQSVQLPILSGHRQFGGWQEATMDFAVTPESSKGTERRLSISCRIERFVPTQEKEADTRAEIPPPKHTSNLDFSVSTESGKLVMASVQSSAAPFGGNYVLFLRVRS